VSTSTLTRPQPKHAFTSIWAIDPAGARLRQLRGTGPGLLFEYLHAEDCSCLPDVFPTCRPAVTVAGYQTKGRTFWSEQPYAILVPGDAVRFA
jgi:hypothetical protein